MRQENSDENENIEEELSGIDFGAEIADDVTELGEHSFASSSFFNATQLPQSTPFVQQQNIGTSNGFIHQIGPGLGSQQSMSSGHMSDDDSMDVDHNQSTQGHTSGSDALSPVTIKQIITAEKKFSASNNSRSAGGKYFFEIDERRIYQVDLVAQLMHPKRYPKCIQFRLEDGTGHKTEDDCISSVVATIFPKRNENGEESLELPQTQPQFHSGKSNKAEDLYEIFGCKHLDYVRVIADISFSELSRKNALIIRCMRKVDNPHEVFYHQLQVAVNLIGKGRDPPPPLRMQPVRQQQEANESRSSPPPTSSDQYRDQQTTPQTPQRSRLPPGAAPRTPATPSPSKRSNENPVPRLPAMSITSSSRPAPAMPSEHPMRIFRRDTPNIPSTEQNRKRSFSDDGSKDPDDDEHFPDRSESPSLRASRNADSRSSPSVENSPRESPKRRFDRGDLFSTPLSQPQFRRSRVTSNHQVAEVSNQASKGKKTQVDPYSHLSLIERHIISFIEERREFFQEENIVMPGSLDPSGGRGPVYDGVTAESIRRTVKSLVTNAMTEEVNSAIRKLCDEGYIYTTIDDFHYDVNRLK